MYVIILIIKLLRAVIFFTLKDIRNPIIKGCIPVTRFSYARTRTEKFKSF